MPSSVIHGMVYAPQQRELFVVFRESGETYRYYDVSAAEWKAFRRAPSKGTYLNHTFKTTHPRFERFDGIMAPEASAAAATAWQGLLRDLPDENVWGFYELSTL